MDQYRTEDLALVTYLRINDVYPEHKERKGKVLCWLFERTDHLEGLIEEYQRGEAHVEIKDCVQKLAQVRRDMYESLDIRPASARG